MKDILTLTPPPSDQALAGAIQLPGSKSETNRALVLAALCSRPFRVQNVSDSDDSRVLLDYLAALQIPMQPAGTDALVSSGSLAQASASGQTIHLGLAGTSLRFLTALSCLLPGSVVLDGEPRLRERPIQPLLHCLTEAGATIEYLDKPGCLPYRIHGNPGWQPASFTIDASGSSQYLTALLLLAPSLPLGCTIQLAGGALASVPYARLTLALLARCGLVWQQTGDSTYVLASNTFDTASCTVESDWSAASYWLGLACTRSSRFILQGLHPASLQGDAAQLEVWRSWGLGLDFTTHGLAVSSNAPIAVPAFTIDCLNTPDLAQTYAVMALYSQGPCTLTGLHTLRGKETDRIAALQAELAKFGAATEVQGDTLVITPPADLPAAIPPISTYHDHRMAMAFSLAAERCGGIRIEQPGVVTKSYPHFWQHLQLAGYTVM